MNQAFVSDPFDTFGRAVGFASVVLVSSLVSQCSLYAFLFHFDHYWSTGSVLSSCIIQLGFHSRCGFV